MGTERVTRSHDLVMGTEIVTRLSNSFRNYKWRIAQSPPNFRYCCILHCLTHFLFLKPAVLSVFCGATDAICICT